MTDDLLQRRGQSVTALALGLVLALGCAPQTEPEETAAGKDLTARAQHLAETLLIVDTHVDVPYRLVEEMEDISVATEGGDFDYPRAVAGGLNAPFMSIYVPASFQETGGAKEHADRLIDMVEGFERESPDKFAVARSPADLEAHLDQGLISLPMGMENGAPIEGDLENLRYFFDRGIRYITLTHSTNNHICDSSYATEPTWNGLSPFGGEVVAEMNRLGIMIDVSHISDEAFYDVMEITQAPVIASHSSCRSFTPGWERNMSDEMIQVLAANGGVLHVNFGSAFLTEAANRHSVEMFAAAAAYVEENDIPEGDPRRGEFFAEYRKENPLQLADVSDVADHIDHVVELVGVDYVGLGSDYDGVGPTTPTGLEDVSTYPNLIRVLLERGYTEGEIGKILGGNLLRVWREVEAVAAAR